MTMFKSTMVPPPGGVFFFEHGGERVEARTWPQMESLMRPFAARHGLTGFLDSLVAEYMCPRIPGWYCTGPSAGSYDIVRTKEAWEHAGSYFGRRLVTFDVVADRLRRCAACKAKHQREFCLTCTGHLKAILNRFGGRRTKLPEDELSGICACARTFESIIASVDYDGDDAVWDGTPDTCWRKDK